MHLTNMLAGVLGLALVAAGAGPSIAHSVKVLENQLLERETYVEMTERKAPTFTLKDTEGRTVGLETSVARSWSSILSIRDAGRPAR